MNWTNDMVKKTDTLRTERLTLRGIDETDTAEIVHLRAEPSVFRFFKSPHQITPAEHINWYSQKYLYDDSRFDWICIENASGKKIGVFGLVKDEDTAEVNYLLAKESQHNGYAAEAVTELMRYAADHWHCSRIIAEIHEDNQPSIGLAERLGFRLISYHKPFAIYEIEVEQSDSDQNRRE